MPRLPKSLWPAAGAIGALLACAGCGNGFSVPNQPDASSQLPARWARIGTSTVARVPSGGRIRVTLVAYNPRVHEHAPRGPNQPVAGLRLLIRNVSKQPVSTGPPSRFSSLVSIDALDENSIAPKHGPCAGPFQSTPIRLRPGQSMRGCVPYSYPPDEPPLEFVFEFNQHAGKRWGLPH
jgi:hypothetical protein